LKDKIYRAKAKEEKGNWIIKPCITWQKSESFRRMQDKLPGMTEIVFILQNG